MKKKLLLIALPTLMVLSGCSKVPIKPVEKEVLSDTAMFEDTAAHEELFGDIDLDIKKIGVPDPNPGSGSIPKIGVQFSGLYKGDERDSYGNLTGNKADFYAIRYVAAIKGDLSNQTVTWTRGVSQVNSTQVREMSSVGHDSTPLNSATAYASLNDNGVAVGVPSGYDNYVVYTMYDIPSSEANSYIAAYVTVTPDVGEAAKSYAVVTEIDGGYYFSVDTNSLIRNGYFIEGTIGGYDHTIITEDNEGDTDTDPENGGKDNSIFSDYQFSDDDEFGLFRLTSTCFQFYGYDTFMGSSASSFINSSDAVNQFGRFSKDGQYTLFLNASNLVYPIVTTTLFLDTSRTLEGGSKWGAGARFAIWAWGPTKERWYDMTNETGDIYKIEGYNVTDYPNLKFCRMNPGVASNGWDKDNPLYNNTGNLSVVVPGDSNIITNNMYTITAWNDTGNGTDNANWSNYGAA